MPKIQEQFCMLRYLALVVQQGTLGIDACGKENFGGLHPRRRKLFGVLGQRQRVQIDNAVDRVVLVLHANPVAQCTEIVPDMDVASRLNSRKDPFTCHLFTLVVGLKRSFAVERLSITPPATALV